MGLATIDPHGQKEHTEIHKIPKFGVLTEIQAFKNVKKFTKKCMEMRTNPDIIYRLVPSPSRYEISQ